MTSDVRTCRSETNPAEAVREMWDGDCGALPVVNDEGRVNGVITDRDVCIAVATRGRSADRIAVREVAQGHVYICLPEDDGATALQLMKTRTRSAGFPWSTQLIATSADVLWPQVKDGAFPEAQYYRINVICIDLTDGTHSGGGQTLSP